ncbi:hypothetical protein VIA_000084 [Vibrio orientalis CIP 102891 = ATCC 33934]|uniref:Uncharacterized protein n=1 Tax=Vibrio orientalis CIP 102891 = ATCC 33934 TaxID=675816 RepID=A0ABM9Z784_VIBOR|nr:hypothetical protein VIA_000084 [Vibrio orientalis CIP 102891 = ATCC 33934]
MIATEYIGMNLSKLNPLLRAVLVAYHKSTLTDFPMGKSEVGYDK